MVGSTPFGEKEADVGKKATAKALVGLVNDLTDEQLLALTDSANRRALKKFLCEALVLPVLKSKAKFVVSAKFTLANTTVKFSYIGPNFKSWFYGKTEEAKSVVVPRPHHDLRKDSLDCEILADLGGKANAEVTMAGIYELLKLQPNGEAGVLLTSGYANIFYVRDVTGVLRAVRVDRRDDGWYVSARSVEHPIRWGVGYRVFSC